MKEELKLLKEYSAMAIHFESIGYCNNTNQILRIACRRIPLKLIFKMFSYEE